jgi:catechol-2,3-dioxygenase
VQPIDPRPGVWVGHVVLETDRLAESEKFMRTIGMRPIALRSEVAVFELRGGTHLVLVAKATVQPGAATFDLMVDDLESTYERFVSLGLNPTPIESVLSDHRQFVVQEPSGHSITFFSSHVAGRAV